MVMMMTTMMMNMRTMSVVGRESSNKCILPLILCACVGRGGEEEGVEGEYTKIPGHKIVCLTTVVTWTRTSSLLQKLSVGFIILSQA
jgi:hypothetical protein